MQIFSLWISTNVTHVLHRESSPTDFSFIKRGCSGQFRVYHICCPSCAVSITRLRSLLRDGSSRPVEHNPHDHNVYSCLSRRHASTLWEVSLFTGWILEIHNFLGAQENSQTSPYLICVPFRSQRRFLSLLLLPATTSTCVAALEGLGPPATFSFMNNKQHEIGWNNEDSLQNTDRKFCHNRRDFFFKMHCHSFHLLV